MLAAMGRLLLAGVCEVVAVVDGLLTTSVLGQPPYARR